MSTLKSLIKQVLTEKENRHYRKLLAEKNVSYDSWVREREESLAAEAGCETVEVAQEVAVFSEDWGSILCMPGGRISRTAKCRIEEYLVKNPQVLLVYGDEDVLADSVRAHPWYKPQWSPDLFDSWYYLGSLVAVRRELLERCPHPDSMKPETLVSWLRSCLEVCGGWQKDCRTIGHLSEILYHCDSIEIQERYLQWKTSAVAKDINLQNLLSVIIPSKDHPDILQQCVRSLAEKEKKLNYELIIVDNGSTPSNRSRVENMLREEGKHAEYIYAPMEFNFSRMCNLGAEKARGNLLLFLNDDVELLQENCLSELAGYALQEHAGAVGMKLCYPHSRRIQHAGITNLPMGPVHKLQFLEDDRDYYFKTNRGIRNVLAVTAACLMVEKKKYLEVQGFAEDLKVAFNDVDFCFKLYESGYQNICDNTCYSCHHESLSRGDDESTEKWLRLCGERDKLYARHPALRGRDPYYGTGLAREGLDTRVRPECETAGNCKQRIQKQGKRGIKSVSPDALRRYRQDNCLLLRIENCTENLLQGYAVVLGDNNACYEKTLVLEGGEQYLIFTEEQYRPDLVENLPDQVHVGLCGFWLELSAGVLPAGSYRIGMLARNRVTGMKLINWSSRILTVKLQDEEAQR